MLLQALSIIEDEAERQMRYKDKGWTVGAIFLVESSYTKYTTIFEKEKLFGFLFKQFSGFNISQSLRQFTRFF